MNTAYILLRLCYADWEAAQIFRALAPGRERDIESYEKLYSHGLLD